MKKSLILGLFIAFAVQFVSAGDVATFVDKGFTEDGKYYVFGQYGKIDKKFQGYAEIYQVDIKANDYVDSGLFKTKPSAVTADKNGRDVYDALEAKSYFYYKNLPTTVANPDQILYILDDVTKVGTDRIVFKDFTSSEIECPDSYEIQLVPSVKGTGKNCKSSFYINLEKKDADGNVIYSKQVGSPNINRKGVTGYKIERIFCDKSQQNFIFVIEKIIEDDSGISIRYMVEAVEI